MNTRNRFGAGALVALALALCTGGAAVAGDILLPPPDSPSPAASGMAQTRYNLNFIGDGPGECGGFPAVTQFQVSGLLPNTTYAFIVSHGESWCYYVVVFTTDRRGKGSGKTNWFGGGPGTAVYTVVDGNGVVVLVGQEE